MHATPFVLSAALVFGLSACRDPMDGRPGNPPRNAAKRALGRNAGTSNSGAFPYNR